MFRVVTLNLRCHGCFLPHLSGFRYMLSGNGCVYDQWCNQKNEYLRELCAKHLSAYVILFPQHMFKVNSFFFHVRDMPLRFNSFYLYFSKLTGQIDPNFYINCYGWTIHSSPNFRPPKFFSASFQRKKSFFRVFRGQRENFKSCLYSQLKNANVCALIDRTPFSWLACSDFFPHFFSGKFSSKRSWSFWNRFDIPCCPPPFLALTLNFYNTFARSFAFCLAASIENFCT